MMATRTKTTTTETVDDGAVVVENTTVSDAPVNEVSNAPVNEIVQSPAVEGATLRHLTDDDFTTVEDANGNVQPHAVPREWIGTHLLPPGWQEHKGA